MTIEEARKIFDNIGLTQPQWEALLLVIGENSKRHPDLLWTSVTDGLPERVLKCEPIIDVIIANDGCVGQGTYNDLNGVFNWNSGAIAHNVTHWMLLPKHPRLK